MFKNSKIKIIISSLVTLLPMIAGMIIWNKLPQNMATSFDLNGNVTGYSSKEFAVVGLPLILLAVNLLCIFITLQDPKRKNIYGKIFNIILCIIPACSLFCGVSIYSKALNYNVNIEKIMPVFIGILFVVFGCFLPESKQNYTIGIKLPWTLNDEENWDKTHKMAGAVWIGGGIIMAIAGFFKAEAIFIGVIIAVALIPAIYSYIIYRKKQKMK